MKSSAISVVFLVSLFVTLLIGCGTSRDPIAGGTDGDVAPAVQQPSDSRCGTGNRVLWGLWKISISADRQTITVVPDRVGALHFNVVRLLEVAPCTDCLRVKNVQVIPDGLRADVTLVHPFPGLLRYTGFDIRGIFISGEDYTFPVSGRKIAWGDDVARMLNPDGYTHLFNPTDFPYTKPPILGYIPGHKAPGGDLSATLNPYVAYEQQQPRCVFMPGTASTRTVELHFPPGPLEFGYAVDASWFPAGVEVTDPVNDFPPEANCMEAYRADVQLGQGLNPTVGSEAQVQVEVCDHQGLESIESVTIEAPDLFSGERALSFSTATGEESFLFTGIVANELGPDKGRYPLLVRIVDTETDGNLGAVDAWHVARISIREGWARTWGGAEQDESHGVAVDGSGNVYATGWFVGTVDFNPDGGDPHASNGWDDVFLVKFGSSGEFQWARTWGGSDTDWSCGLSADESGNVYVTGIYTGTAEFDPGGGDPHTSNGWTDVFLSKFDSSGNFEWARTWGGPGWDWGAGVVADGSGNVYVTGYFQGAVDFEPGGGDPHTGDGANDVFLSKFDSSGNFQWARTWGGPSWDWGVGVVADGSGNAYVTGYFQGIVNFDPGGGDPRTSNGKGDVFLSKFDSSGDFQWARTWGGAGDDWGHGVAAYDSGNAYVAGLFHGTVDFNPSGGDPHTPNGEVDVFLSKFDSSGNFEWARTWGGSDEDYGYGVAADGFGNVYVTGFFVGTADFDPDGGDPHASNGYWDVFLSKFDSSGNFKWARTWGGPVWDWGRGVAADGSGNAYVVGAFSDTVDFAPADPPCNDDPDEHTSSGESDAFLTKHLADGCW